MLAFSIIGDMIVYGTYNYYIKYGDAFDMAKEYDHNLIIEDKIGNFTVLTVINSECTVCGVRAIDTHASLQILQKT